MSKADKMFEKLAYKKLINKEKTVIRYEKIFYFNGYKIIRDIKYYLLDKDVVIQSYNDYICQRVDTSLETEELQAINEKCEELGWI